LRVHRRRIQGEKAGGRAKQGETPGVIFSGSFMVLKIKAERQKTAWGRAEGVGVFVGTLAAGARKTEALRQSDGPIMIHDLAGKSTY